MEKYYKAYMNILGKCDKKTGELNIVRDKIETIAKKYNCICGRMVKDITEEKYITYATTIFMNTKTREEYDKLYNAIKNELELNGVCILSDEGEYNEYAI